MKPEELKNKISTESPVNKLLKVLASQDISQAMEGGWKPVNVKVRIVTEEDAKNEAETGNGPAIAGIFVDMPNDQVGFIFSLEGNFIGIIGNWRSRRFGQNVLQGFRKNALLPVESLFVPFNGWILPATRLSDHASFWDSGWPALMVTDTAFFRNPNYHLPSDTIGTLDFDFMAELVMSLELALLELPARTNEAPNSNFSYGLS